MPNPFEETNPIARAAYETQARRLGILAAIYEKHLPERLSKTDIWVGKMMNRFDCQALAILLAEKGIITLEQFMDKARDQMEIWVDERQKELKVVIRADDVLQQDRPQLPKDVSPAEGANDSGDQSNGRASDQGKETN